MIASIITRVNLRRGYGRTKAGICEGRASSRGGRRRQVDALIRRTPGVRVSNIEYAHRQEILASGRGMKLDTESRRD